jgi:rubrerythrin
MGHQADPADKGRGTASPYADDSRATDERALYLCLRCSHTWSGPPGPVVCPLCRHERVRWLNYKDPGETEG